ncbi:hypothetical protein AHAS_Ahas13G0226500 [Arachis hypogaea]
MMIVVSMVQNFLAGIITGRQVIFLNQFENTLLYYISIDKYAYQRLFKNEFEGLKLTNKNNSDQVGEHMNNISGERNAERLMEVEMCRSKWVDLFILLG